MGHQLNWMEVSPDNEVSNDNIVSGHILLGGRSAGESSGFR